LLVDHINAGLWLPPGGHIEPDEDPVDTARREAREELGIDAVFAISPPRPLFVTVKVTGGLDAGHTDVSLWLVLIGEQSMALTPDPGEFNDVRWWSLDDVLVEPAGQFDPNFGRFVAKLRAHPRRTTTGEGATEATFRNRAGGNRVLDPSHVRVVGCPGKARRSPVLAARH
jgi:8-oxo-dGTP diphosphatase